MAVLVKMYGTVEIAAVAAAVFFKKLLRVVAIVFPLAKFIVLVIFSKRIRESEARRVLFHEFLRSSSHFNDAALSDQTPERSAKTWAKLKKHG